MTRKQRLPNTLSSQLALLVGLEYCPYELVRNCLAHGAAEQSGVTQSVAEQSVATDKAAATFGRVSEQVRKW